MALRHLVRYLHFICALHCAKNKISITEKAKPVHKANDTLIYPECREGSVK